MKRDIDANALIPLILLLLMCAIPNNTYALSDKSEKSITIDILVRGDDEAKDFVEGTIARILDSMPRTQVVKNTGDWELSIAVTHIKEADARVSGYIVSTVIIKRLNTSDLKTLLGCDPDSAKVNDILMYVNHWQFSGGSGALKSLCEKIVSDFDREYLQKWR